MYSLQDIVYDIGDTENGLLFFYFKKFHNTKLFLWILYQSFRHIKKN